MKSLTVDLDTDNLPESFSPGSICISAHIAAIWVDSGVRSNVISWLAWAAGRENIMAVKDEGEGNLPIHNDATSCKNR